MSDIIDVSRIEANRLMLRPERTAIRTLIESIAVLFEGVAHQKGLAIDVEIDAQLSGDVLADAVRLKQVLANLLSNAIKFTDSGSVVLRALVTAKDAQYLRFRLCVEDTGPCIDERTRLRLFKPFEQGESGIAAGGSGLGLYICHTLVNMMGGTITLHSQPGSGTRIEVDLSLPCLSPQSESHAPESENGSQPLSRQRILIVDDNPVGLMLLKEQLLHLNQQAICAAGGREALDILANRSVDW